MQHERVAVFDTALRTRVKHLFNFQHPVTFETKPPTDPKYDDTLTALTHWTPPVDPQEQAF